MVGILVFIGLDLGLGPLYWVGVAAVVGCLFYEHALVWGGNLEKVDMAFFTVNGVVSLIFGLATIGAVLMG